MREKPSLEIRVIISLGELWVTLSKHVVSSLCCLL